MNWINVLSKAAAFTIACVSVAMLASTLDNKLAVFWCGVVCAMIVPVATLVYGAIVGRFPDNRSEFTMIVPYHLINEIFEWLTQYTSFDMTGREVPFLEKGKQLFIVINKDGYTLERHKFGVTKDFVSFGSARVRRAIEKMHKQNGK